MIWNRDDGPPQRGYHHGNLKEALIRAALDLIAQKGPSGFTFAEAARFAGVSPAAPYRHFRDRDELLANVALRGFALFEAALGEGVERRPARSVTRPSSASAAPIWTSPAPSPPTIPRCSRPAFPLEVSQELRDAGDRAFAVIRGAAERLVALASAAAQRPPAFMVALHVWALAHGIASLFGRGDAGRRKLPMQPEELLEAGVLVYLRGLGLPNDAAVGPLPPS